MRIDAFRITVLLLAGFIVVQALELWAHVKEAQAFGIGQQPSISIPRGEKADAPPPPEVDHADQIAVQNPQRPENMPAATILRAVFRMEEDRALALTPEQCAKLLEMIQDSYKPQRTDYSPRLIPILSTAQLKYIVDHRMDAWEGPEGRAEATLRMLEARAGFAIAAAPPPPPNPPNVFPDQISRQLTPEDLTQGLILLESDPSVTLSPDQASAVLSILKAWDDQRAEEESFNQQVLDLLTEPQRKAVDAIRANVANLPGSQAQEINDLLLRLRDRSDQG